MNFDENELIFLILQFLQEEKLTETLHELEKESRLHFNLKYFEWLVLGGDWEEADKYLSGFTDIESNHCTRDSFLDLRSENFLEALARSDHQKALGILVKDMQVFAKYEPGVVNQFIQLLDFKRTRGKDDLSSSWDTDKGDMMLEFKKLIDVNPDLRSKLTFPSFEQRRLKKLINQSLNWQKHLCQDKEQDHQINSIYQEHSCEEPDNVVVPLQPGSVQMLPRNLVVVLNQGSCITSMDFHPSWPSILLVGTKVGDIAVWDILRTDIFTRMRFKDWEIPKHPTLQSSLAKESTVSVNRVVWNSDGRRLAVAYSKHLVHVYRYIGGTDPFPLLEIDAHVGGVNDVGFSGSFVITCGDDQKIKVWDVVKGTCMYTFEGHETAVCSICPYPDGTGDFFVSASVDGKIKTWFYDKRVTRADVAAPGCVRTSVACSADGKRLFCCGTSKVGYSYMMEWETRKGLPIRTYTGLHKVSAEPVQFDTAGNRFIAAGNNRVIKFWDMDNPNLLTTTDAEGGLGASPRIRFNRFGSLLAVSTSDNCIKVLANPDGLRLLQSVENQFISPPTTSDEATAKISCAIPVGSSNPYAKTKMSPSGPRTPATMDFDSRELILLILQFLDEGRLTRSLHKLERESGIYFNMKHFERLVLDGEWEEADNYLFGYTTFANQYSRKIFSEMREQNYLEALHRKQQEHALYLNTTKRSDMMLEFEESIKANPDFKNKLTFPSFKKSGLKSLIDQRQELSSSGK